MHMTKMRRRRSAASASKRCGQRGSSVPSRCSSPSAGIHFISAAFLTAVGRESSRSLLAHSVGTRSSLDPCCLRSSPNRSLRHSLELVPVVAVAKASCVRRALLVDRVPTHAHRSNAGGITLQPVSSKALYRRTLDTKMVLPFLRAESQLPRVSPASRSQGHGMSWVIPIRSGSSRWSDEGFGTRATH